MFNQNPNKSYFLGRQFEFLKRLYLLVLLICFLSCKTDKENEPLTKTGKTLILKYAKGFSIDYFESYRVLSIKKPWPNAEESYTYILSDSTIKTPIQKIVVTSTTHIPALELLGVEQTLVGFSWLRLYFFRKNQATR